MMNILGCLDVPTSGQYILSGHDVAHLEDCLLYTSSISIIMLIVFLITHLCGNTVPGWTTIVISVWAIGGLQLLAIGIIGEYIGKIYMESKARPKYIIQDFLK